MTFLGQIASIKVGCEGSLILRTLQRLVVIFLGAALVKAQR
jgi:hypothetical protein